MIGGFEFWDNLICIYFAETFISKQFVHQLRRKTAKTMQRQDKIAFNFYTTFVFAKKFLIKNSFFQ